MWRRAVGTGVPPEDWAERTLRRVLDDPVGWTKDAGSDELCVVYASLVDAMQGDSLRQAPDETQARASKAAVVVANELHRRGLMKAAAEFRKNARVRASPLRVVGS